MALAGGHPYVPGPPRPAASAALNRRLGIAVLVSLLVHGFVLSLRFGMPGLALPGLPSSISVRLAEPAPVPPPLPVPEATPPEPVARPAQALPPARPAAKKDKPLQSRRISTPLPAREARETPTKVIAQDVQPNDNFVVPLPQPEEALQKTIDPVEAQHGSDQGQDASTAAAQAEADAVRAAALAERQKLADAAAEQKAALALAERLKADELAAEQARALELAERQKAAELVAAQQRAQELAERRKAEQLAAQQKADEAARKLAEEAARQREQQQAAEQLERAAAQARAGAAPGAGGGGAAASKNLFGSDAANRVRELSKGLDLLSGNPPPRTRGDDERGQRRAVVGSAERDLPLRMYAESWRQKIERNGAVNFPQRIGDRARIDPLVSVALRSDGSVEEVTIVRSSGRADTDDAVRRIVRLNARYSAFPPNIAARYDVIEIRRIWTFDEVLKLIEEVR